MGARDKRLANLEQPEQIEMVDLTQSYDSRLNSEVRVGFTQAHRYDTTRNTLVDLISEKDEKTESGSGVGPAETQSEQHSIESHRSFGKRHNSFKKLILESETELSQRPPPLLERLDASQLEEEKVQCLDHLDLSLHPPI